MISIRHSKYLLLFLLIYSLQITSKILIFTHSYNRPDFIELQLKTFKIFLKDEYEYVVFNDAREENMRRQIEQTCQRLGVRCIRIPQNIHIRQDAGARHIDGIMFALKSIGYDFDGIVTLIDSDAFLVKPFSIEEYLKGYDIAGESQGRANDRITVGYLSPVIVFMNMQTLPNKRTINFEGGYIEGLACDVGGHTYYYFKNNPTIKHKFLDVIHIGVFKFHLHCKECSNLTCSNCCDQLIKKNFDDKIINFIQSCPDHDMDFYLSHIFLHYRSGSNWNYKPAEYHRLKTRALQNYIDDIIRQQSINDDKLH